MQIILPKTYVPEERITEPFFFLGGPIKGGGDWQKDAVYHIFALQPECTIAVPCRWTPEHELYQYVMTSDQEEFPRQLLWERYYLDKASVHRGCIIFWLPCEDPDHPRLGNQPYARDTYGELGEWRGHLMHDRYLHVAIGMQPGFPGESVIEGNFAAAVPDLQICKTLPETIAKAIALARS